MNFLQYLNSLKIPLKVTSMVFAAVFGSIAKSFNKAVFYVYEVLHSCFIQSGSNISLYAEDRGLEQLKNESDRDFYNRTLNAYRFLKNCSTKKGIEDILMSFTDKAFVIKEQYKNIFVLGEAMLGVNSELTTIKLGYYFIVEFAESISEEEKSYMEDLLNTFKPAHTDFCITNK